MSVKVKTSRTEYRQKGKRRVWGENRKGRYNNLGPSIQYSITIQRIIGDHLPKKTVRKHNLDALNMPTTLLCKNRALRLVVAN